MNPTMHYDLFTPEEFQDLVAAAYEREITVDELIRQAVFNDLVR